MRLNTLKPACGAKTAKMRVGRGIGCGKGKTCGRGHKGQKARSGYSRKIGFEGGQIPLQRRLPKYGFRSMSKGDIEEVRLDSLNKVTVSEIGLAELKLAGLISKTALGAKVILAGAINKSITLLASVKATAGVKKAIEAAGGTITN